MFACPLPSVFRDISEEPCSPVYCPVWSEMSRKHYAPLSTAQCGQRCPRSTMLPCPLPSVFREIREAPCSLVHCPVWSEMFQKHHAPLSAAQCVQRRPGSTMLPYPLCPLCSETSWKHHAPLKHPVAHLQEQKRLWLPCWDQHLMLIKLSRTYGQVLREP